jgi:hypothetical protein
MSAVFRCDLPPGNRFGVTIGISSAFNGPATTIYLPEDPIDSCFSDGKLEGLSTSEWYDDLGNWDACGAFTLGSFDADDPTAVAMCCFKTVDWLDGACQDDPDTRCDGPPVTLRIHLPLPPP